MSGITFKSRILSDINVAFWLHNFHLICLDQNIPIMRDVTEQFRILERNKNNSWIRFFVRIRRPHINIDCIKIKLCLGTPYMRYPSVLPDNLCGAKLAFWPTRTYPFRKHRKWVFLDWKFNFNPDNDFLWFTDKSLTRVSQWSFENSLASLNSHMRLICH